MFTVADRSVWLAVKPSVTQRLADTDNDRIGLLRIEGQHQLSERSAAEIDGQIAARQPFDRYGAFVAFDLRIIGRFVVIKRIGRAEGPDFGPVLLRIVVVGAHFPVIDGIGFERLAVVNHRSGVVVVFEACVPHIAPVPAQLFAARADLYLCESLLDIRAHVIEHPAEHRAPVVNQRHLHRLDRPGGLFEGHLRRIAVDPHPVGVLDQVGHQPGGRGGGQRRRGAHQAQQTGAGEQQKSGHRFPVFSSVSLQNNASFGKHANPFLRFEKIRKGLPVSPSHRFGPLSNRKTKIPARCSRLYAGVSEIIDTFSIRYLDIVFSPVNIPNEYTDTR